MNKKLLLFVLCGFSSLNLSMNWEDSILWEKTTSQDCEAVCCCCCGLKKCMESECKGCWSSIAQWFKNKCSRETNGDYSLLGDETAGRPFAPPGLSEESRMEQRKSVRFEGVPMDRLPLSGASSGAETGIALTSDGATGMFTVTKNNDGK